MKYYFLAFMIWIVLIILCLTIIRIPIAIYLKSHFDWFDAPFEMAYEYDCYY